MLSFLCLSICTEKIYPKQKQKKKGEKKKNERKKNKQTKQYNLKNIKSKFKIKLKIKGQQQSVRGDSE